MTALDRKFKTEKLLKSLGVPILEQLPLIDEEHEVKLRTAQEVARRILILDYLNYVADEPDSKQEVIDFLKEQNLHKSISDKEKQFFKYELTEQDRINISWQSEAMLTLLWAIGKVDKLEMPVEETQVSEWLSLLPDLMTDPKEFIDAALLRPIPEILDLLDLTYRMHWAVRNAELNNLDALNFDAGIIQERHYALNWLTYYNDDWDDVVTDT
ncbi:DUF4272 domain-containing protein [Pedobacter panaciterrae]|uniref:DUF4272 domain-containing protein n=1 Tax=Pedobacter panaciterrae TaxID=363849 RepID=UPI0025961E47|nr:DUF4272 domain-containing protein [uncultured Pedobacter sp.]